MGNWKQGKIETTNLPGYNGKQRVLTYRSSWEYKTIKILINLVKLGKVKSWHSEETVIKYYFSLDKTPKERRYFMDFTLEMADGSIVLIEVKPAKEAAKIKDNEIIDYKPPKKGKNPKTNQDNIITFIRNGDKWKRTCELCNEMTQKTGTKWKFVIWTEKELKI